MGQNIPVLPVEGVPPPGVVPEFMKEHPNGGILLPNSNPVPLVNLRDNPLPAEVGTEVGVQYDLRVLCVIDSESALHTIRS